MIIPPIKEMTIQELEKLGWHISDEGYERLLDEAENDDPRIWAEFFQIWLENSYKSSNLYFEKFFDSGWSKF